MEPLDEEIGSWLEHEVAGCQFQDVRHGKRFVTLVAQLLGHIGGSIPFACQDWAATKAAYRFLSNARVDEEKILAGHFLCTRERFAAMKDSSVLVLHDTTEFSYHRDDPEAVGILQRLASPYAHGGQPGHHITCGILMHSSLVVTRDGLPLGLAAIKFWSRDKFHGANALKRSINPTRVPIEQTESYRWLENVRQSTAMLAEPERIVHIGDRESDIYELFSIAHQAGTHFLLRTCVDRFAGEGDHTVADEMREVRVKGLHRVEVRDKKGTVSEAVLELRYRRIRVLAPVAKQKIYPPLMLTVLHATERDPPKGREPIDWKLVTDLSIRSRREPFSPSSLTNCFDRFCAGERRPPKALRKVHSRRDAVSQRICGTMDRAICDQGCGWPGARPNRNPHLLRNSPQCGRIGSLTGGDNDRCWPELA